MTFHFTGAVAWDVLGTSVRIAANKRSVSIIDPATLAIPTGMVQGGVSVSWITVDARGRYGFACDAPSVVVDFGAGPWDLTADEVPGMVAAFAVSDDTAIAATFGNAASASRGVADGLYVPGTTDSAAYHNVLINPGSTTTMDAQGTFYGNLLIGGGGQAGASPNLMTGQATLRTCIGGYDNHHGASLASGIIHGMHHVIDGGSTHACLVGGSYATATDSDYSTILGGTANSVGATGAPANYSAILGGQTNTTAGFHAGILAGHDNVAGGVASAIIGGEHNAIYGSYAAASGDSNLAGTSAQPAYGSYTALLGGLANQVGQTANASYTGILGGRDHRSDAQYTGILGGQGARPRHIGETAQAMGSFAAAGDAQVLRAVVRRSITTATSTGLYLDTTGHLALPDNASWSFSATVTARCAATAEVAAWEYRGVIKRGSGVATTAIVGTPELLTLATVSPWTPSVIADVTNGSLLFEIAGDASKTLICVGRVEITEVVA